MQTNSPDLWQSRFPWPQAEGNKYDRGHAIVVGGPIGSTGATKLAATAALRVGAGLVSVACDKESLPVYASSLTSVMTKPVMNTRELKELIQPSRIRSVLIGPGAGLSEQTRDFTLTLLEEKKPTVLDADALTIFTKNPKDLFVKIKSPCILTPHAGEFERIFPQLLAMEDRAAAAQKASQMSNAVIVLKGMETIIAAPDGRVVINKNATPFLATAGTGDVLAGLCLGLLAQGMEVFNAACAAVWLHSETARAIGPGLIAEDLQLHLPAMLTKLMGQANGAQKL